MQHAGIARPKPLIVAHLLLLLAERPRHGYELAASLRTWEFQGVTSSMVYRELSRLEEEGLVRSFWEASQARGPARHMYELTPAGHDNLTGCADDLRRLRSHLADFLAQFAMVDPAGEGQPAALNEPGSLKSRRRLRKPR